MGVSACTSQRYFFHRIVRPCVFRMRVYCVQLFPSLRTLCVSIRSLPIQIALPYLYIFFVFVVRAATTHIAVCCVPLLRHDSGGYLTHSTTHARTFFACSIGARAPYRTYYNSMNDTNCRYIHIASVHLPALSCAHLNRRALLSHALASAGNAFFKKSICAYPLLFKCKQIARPLRVRHLLSALCACTCVSCQFARVAPARVKNRLSLPDLVGAVSLPHLARF